MENEDTLLLKILIFDVINKFNFKWIENKLIMEILIQLLMFIITKPS